jgi:hypothetical protein
VPPTPTATATATPTSTPTPTPTATPTPPILQVTPPAGTSFTCGGDVHDTLTVHNNGGGTLNWSASANDPGVTLSQTSGSLGAGGSAPVAVDGIGISGGFIVDFTDGGSQDVTVPYTCTPP